MAGGCALTIDLVPWQTLCQHKGTPPEAAGSEARLAHVSDLRRLASEHTEISPELLERLQRLVADWGLIADLGFADLLLWLPTWNGSGYVVAAHQRPDTGRTLFLGDMVGTFVGRGRHPLLDRTVAAGQSQYRVDERAGTTQYFYPILDRGRVVAIVARYRMVVASESAGRLEAAYLEAADRCCDMVVSGDFPSAHPVDQRQLRVGGGFIRLDTQSQVRFVSPNAVSAFRRMGVHVDLMGVHLGELIRRLEDQWDGKDPQRVLIASGRAAGHCDISHQEVTLALESLPLQTAGMNHGAVVLVRDVTELRNRERALVTTEASLREVHHRVKNNLQMVAALLRMQARRSESAQVQSALVDAGNRLGAIAAVHDALAHSKDELVDLDAVCDRVIAMITELVPNAQVRRVGSAGFLAPAAAAQLSMCLTELLTNAAEHGGSPPQIRLELALNQEFVLCTVRDQGPGMPSEGAAHASRKLGLQIVTTLVQEAGGQVWWDSGESGGTAAHIRFPRLVKGNTV